MTGSLNLTAEWLETDGRGGFASGTVGGQRTRRYHALLLAATTPPTGRFVLVGGMEVWLETGGQTYFLSEQRYAPDTVYPRGSEWLAEFQVSPWPQWVWGLPDGSRVTLNLLCSPTDGVTLLFWDLQAPRTAAGQTVRLHVRPLLAVRDYHTLQRENAAFEFQHQVLCEQTLRWQPYPDRPAIVSSSNGTYYPAPLWYKSFLYAVERERGLDCVEDLASPGVYSWELQRGTASWILGQQPPAAAVPEVLPVEDWQRKICEQEWERRSGCGELRRAAGQYLVRRGAGDDLTIVAGYPWFTDWGRDTFIALRGLCLATGRLEEAGRILHQWAGTLSEGMLPNRFPDQGDQPEYNAVDASLWFIVAVQEFLEAAADCPKPLRKQLTATALEILTRYHAGTRHQIHCDPADGLLACGEPGLQLTWMDAKVGDRVVTPRIGKPVEVQALWYNALKIAARWDKRWKKPAKRAKSSFREKFWNEERGCLFDVVDVNHEPGAVDARIRPNQIFAVGGLPRGLLKRRQAARVLEVVQAELWTPPGLRSLSPREADYHGVYLGDARQRDGAYHQGTVWCWLTGPFVEAWLRVHGTTPENCRRARQEFLGGLTAELKQAGPGHLPEIADGDPPHQPRGCPFQAWSLGEYLRVSALLDRVEAAAE